MDIEKLKKDLAAAKAESERVNNQLLESEQRNKNLSYENETLRAEIDSLKQAKESAATELGKAKADIENLEKNVADLKKDLEKEKKSASEKAAQILASVGQPPVVIPTSQVSQLGAPSRIAEKLESIIDPIERSSFIQKNRDALMKERAALMRKS